MLSVAIRWLKRLTSAQGTGQLALLPLPGVDRLLALLSQSGSEVFMSKYSFDIPALQQGQRLSIHVERSAAADGGLHVEVCIPSVQEDDGPSKKRKV